MTAALETAARRRQMGAPARAMGTAGGGEADEPGGDQDGGAGDGGEEEADGGAGGGHEHAGEGGAEDAAEVEAGGVEGHGVAQAVFGDEIGDEGLPGGPDDGVAE